MESELPCATRSESQRDEQDIGVTVITSLLRKMSVRDLMSVKWRVPNHDHDEAAGIFSYRTSRTRCMTTGTVLNHI